MRRSWVSRMRLMVFLGALSALAMGLGRDASAAAEFHRLNVVLSGIPTQVGAKNFNSEIDRFNSLYLTPFGFKGLERIGSGWLFDAQIRYFVRPNFAVEGGVGQLRQQVQQEFLPTLAADLQVRAEVLSVPVHVGGAYYFSPYRQGDFAARAYVGGGFLSSVYNRARIETAATGLGTVADRANTMKVTGHGDSPGFYVETGAHLFFATRYSLMMGLQYRSAMVRHPWGTLERTDLVTGVKTKTLYGPLTNLDATVPLSRMDHLDLGGLGLRFGLSIGF